MPSLPEKIVSQAQLEAPKNFMTLLFGVGGPSSLLVEPGQHGKQQGENWCRLQEGGVKGPRLASVA